MLMSTYYPFLINQFPKLSASYALLAYYILKIEIFFLTHLATVLLLTSTHVLPAEPMSPSLCGTCVSLWLTAPKHLPTAYRGKASAGSQSSPESASCPSLRRRSEQSLFLLLVRDKYSKQTATKTPAVVNLLLRPMPNCLRLHLAQLLFLKTQSKRVAGGCIAAPPRADSLTRAIYLRTIY